MAENVQWIRLKVGMFDGNSFKKIKRAKIGGVSYRDKLTAVWFELLDLAGKSNANGYLIDNNEIPYQTFEDIATMLDREEKEIELCMQFFINERMIEIIEDVYCLTNFMKYQNQEGLEKIREQKRIAQAKWRDKKKEAILGNVSEYDICSYCGEKADTVDHIIPRAKGGKDILSNLTPACKRCNCTKNSWDLLVFLNDPFSDFVKKELVLSNPKFNVTYNEETKKYEYVDIYKTSTSNLLSNSISNSNSDFNSNSISNYEENIEDNKEKTNKKEKKPRAKKEFVPPTYEEVLEYAKSRGREDLARKFFDYFDTGEWIDSRGNKVQNWKQKFITWESNNEKGANNGEFGRSVNGTNQAEQTELVGEYW